MRGFLRIWVALAAWLTLVTGAAGIAAQAAPAPPEATHAVNSAELARLPIRPPFPVPPVHPRPPACPADGIPGSRTDRPPVPLERYFLGDWRLGPAGLPGTGPVAALLRDYRRSDAPRSSRLIDCYWDPTADNGQGGWRYPPNSGFAGDPVTVELWAGESIDRFGSDNGRFLAPLGEAYAQRPLPPSNLDTFESRYPNDYHVFRVLKPFRVDGGTAAAWFGQPGGGMQYRLDDAYFPGEVTPSDHADVQWLIDHTYLTPVN